MQLRDLVGGVQDRFVVRNAAGSRLASNNVMLWSLELVTREHVARELRRKKGTYDIRPVIRSHRKIALRVHAETHSRKIEVLLTMVTASKLRIGDVCC